MTSDQLLHLAAQYREDAELQRDLIELSFTPNEGIIY